MNKRDSEILKRLYRSDHISQRELAETVGCSLGSVNKTLKVLRAQGYLDEQLHVTSKTRRILLKNSPQNAIILAAGFGMRMVPINTVTSKGLIEVGGEPLIERIIKQLHDIGINQIYIVVGFLKEKYEYLIDKFSVQLIVNSNYATKNNLYSLSCAARYLGNTYIIPCDLWFKNNPFNKTELYSWYMLSDKIDAHSDVVSNRYGEIVKVKRSQYGNRMIGLCYLTDNHARFVREQMVNILDDASYDDCFWEEILFGDNGLTIWSNVVSDESAIEINTFEQLRELDSHSSSLNVKELQIISEVFKVGLYEITDINVLKKGMTNRSFLFRCNQEKYIMRIPGEGTDKLIDREREYAVYKVLKDKNICDDVVYMNAENGYKITKYWSNAKTCDPFDFNSVRSCFEKLKQFHSLRLYVDHEFDIFAQIEKYELLRGDHSVYKDYEETKRTVMSLKKFIDAQNKDYILTHIDAVPDNFLFVDIDGKTEIRLIDWEYAGMQDPHVDIAMFCIYSMYDQEQIDKAIDIYFENDCVTDVRTKIYCYIAICGLLWSNWCEYKQSLGVDFGEYSLAQYRFAKIYSKKALDIIGDRCE